MPSPTSGPTLRHRPETTRTPGDPASYVDIGRPVLASGGGDTAANATYNAIDPAIQRDAGGAWWMVFGSHFDGISSCGWALTWPRPWAGRAWSPTVAAMRSR
jgi:hypothetical protein